MSPQRLDRRGAVSVGLHAVAERHVLLVENLALLLTHGATQQVGGAQRVSGDPLGDGHDLLLINDQAVRLIEDFRE